MQVIIADDDAAIREALSAAVVHSGFDPLIATDGLEALERLGEGKCQLVMTDWEMPNLTGIELCRRIRGTDYGRYIYIILLTSHNQPEEIVAGMEAGADDFVGKPFNLSEVIVRLKAAERILNLGSAEITIFAMAKLAESRDPETGAHLERVRAYCRMVAERLLRDETFPGEVDESFINLIFKTSPLHDIGKVAIPDAILLKPGRLTPGEFEVMKGHTLLGARTLEEAIREHPNASYLKMARQIVLSHHERFDGSGYPFGLAGDEIPLSGRIVALADVYDALSSQRVYKPAYGHAESLKIIRDEAGKHFDPRIVATLDHLGDAFDGTRTRFRDASAVS